MERIIITERDNTSNVEALSSYDVVYVPGFSLGVSGTINKDHYRNPTLCTTKYQFLSLFGNVTPQFKSTQYYPKATDKKRGFPEYAIPNGKVASVYTKIEVVNFKDIKDIADSGFYTVETANAESTWQPQSGKTYFTPRKEVQGYVVEKISSAPYEGKAIFQGVDPKASNWYELKGSEYEQTKDTVIDLTKTYYRLDSNVIPMFNGPETATGKGGDADPGYRYALMLLSLGIPVYFEQMNESLDDITVESMYAGLQHRFWTTGDPVEQWSDYSFDNIGDYSVKYITSGGYPTYEYGLLSSDKKHTVSDLAQAMIDIAYKRQDAIALIDHTDNPDRPILALGTVESTSVIDRVRADFLNLGTGKDSYATMFTPHYECSHSAITGGADGTFSSSMPASLAFLSALAQQLQNYNPWLAVAGVTRGKVPYCERLHVNYALTNNIADSYQALPDSISTTAPISINPVTYVRNAGYCIWGNRTLRNNASGTKATSFLNIRNLTSDIKKTLYETSQQLMFEQNTDVLWVNFKSSVTPIMDRMVSNYILSDYKITKLSVDPETGDRVPAYKVLAEIKIMPINSVEVFSLAVEIENNAVNVVERS